MSGTFQFLLMYKVHDSLNRSFDQINKININYVMISEETKSIFSISLYCIDVGITHILEDLIPVVVNRSFFVLFFGGILK